MDLPTKESFASLPVPEQVVRLMQVDAKTRREFILSARNSVDLTRALSPELLFYTLKEIGLADAVELLALASPEQVRDMVDLDCWRSDRLDERRILSWLMFLDEAGSGKLAEWVLLADIELLVLLVKRYLEVVRKAEVEEDPDFDQAKYFTFDDQYLLRFLGEGEPILALLLERLRVLDYRTYTYVLENSLLELGSGLEEAALRWRNARLADRGYPSYEEARELFRFVAPESLSLAQYRRAALPKLRFAGDEELIPSDHALMLLGRQDSFLVRVLAALSREDLEAIGQELALLTNHVVVAETCDPGELTEVRRCVEISHNFLNIGLAYVTKGEEGEGVRLLHETMLQPFFQIGTSLVSRLQRQVQQLDIAFQTDGMQGWATYLDSPFRETCLGLQRKPPLFFRGLETPGEILYRRFQDVGDIERVEAVLIQIPLWFAVMRRWELLPERRVPKSVTLEVLWNTAFARWVVEQQVAIRPLNRAELAIAQKRLRGTKLEEQSETFLALLASPLGLSDEEISALRMLARPAQEKLRDILAVDTASAALRFLEGLLVAG